MVVANALEPVQHAEAQKEDWVGPPLDARHCPAKKLSEKTPWDTPECSARATVFLASG